MRYIHPEDEATREAMQRARNSVDRKAREAVERARLTLKGARGRDDLRDSAENALKGVNRKGRVN